jgi:hypothetical protein
MQSNDERILFVFRHLGGDEHGIRHLLASIGKSVGSLLNARIDDAAGSAASRLLSVGRCWCGLLGGLLRELNLCGRDQEAGYQSSNQSCLQ